MYKRQKRNSASSAAPSLAACTQPESMSVSMIIFPSGGISDTNQTGRPPANAQDYADISRLHTALTRASDIMVGIIRESA